jgi:iduronate 2-sulfatase
LCDLPADPDLAGLSLAPVLANPKGAFKSAAYTQHPRPAYYDRTEKGVPDAMGCSVRTAKVRYTEWRDWETGKIVGRELYEHFRDPHELENTADAPHDPVALAEAVHLLAEQFPPDAPPKSRQQK